MSAVEKMELSQLTTEIARILTECGMISDDVNELGPTEAAMVRFLFAMTRHALMMVRTPEHKQKLFETAAIFQARYNKKLFVEAGQQAIKVLPTIARDSLEETRCRAWAKVYKITHLAPTEVLGDDDEEREHPIGTARQKKTARMQTSADKKRERENPKEPEVAMTLVELDLVEDEDKPKEIWKKKAHTQ